MTALVIKTRPRTPNAKLLLIAVSTKVSKKATARNLIKRRIRAIMKPILKYSEYTYLVIVKPEAIKLNYQELKNELFKKIPNYV